MLALVARTRIPIIALVVLAVACGAAPGPDGSPSTSTPGPCSEIPFDPGNGGFGGEGVRIAAISDTVLCVDSPTRTKFRITPDSDIPEGLQAGDLIVLETLDGRVVRVERDPGVAATS